MTIYEPVYKITTTTTGSVETGNLKFHTTYTPIKWIKYTIIFSPGTNTYANATKKVLDNAPKLYNGRTAKGATLEVTISTKFKGLKQFFAKASSDGTPIFSSNQEDGRLTYSVDMTLAMDIVLADDDDRAINK